MDRRKFLKSGLAGVGMVPALLYGASKSAGYRYTVLIELGGGNDGLNTLVPYADSEYYRARPNIAIDRKSVIRLDSRVGLHPSMKELAEIYRVGEVAVLQGVGYPHPNRSHFRSIDIWNSASNWNEYLDSGWISTLDSRPVSEIGSLVLGGEYGPFAKLKSGILSIQNPSAFLNRSKRMPAQIYMSANNEYLKHLLEVEKEIVESSWVLRRYLDSDKELRFKFPRHGLGREMEIVARLIGGGAGIPFMKVYHGGFDTHCSQSAKHARLLKELSESISILRRNLVLSGKWKDTLIVTYSEFGRRVEENACKGTDHGTASVHFAIGGSVKGGIYGVYPSLDFLDDNGDLVYTDDFRTLYNTIAQKWLSTKSKRVSKYGLYDFI
jgi:uncharacterized protein (DUF1501 family)